MKFYSWRNKNITNADLFVAFDEEEMSRIKALFPEVEDCCYELGVYYGFVDTKRKVFIPLRIPSLVFGGQYNDDSPYGEELRECKIDFKELAWEPFTEIERKSQ